MAKITTRELEEALALIEELNALLEEASSLNWEWKSNRDLQVGDKIATKFDKLTGRAQASVKITEIITNPRGCKAHLHIKGEQANINGCYDFICRTRVMTS